MHACTHSHTGSVAGGSCFISAYNSMLGCNAFTFWGCLFKQVCCGIECSLAETTPLLSSFPCHHSACTTEAVQCAERARCLVGVMEMKCHRIMKCDR